MTKLVTGPQQYQATRKTATAMPNKKTRVVLSEAEARAQIPEGSEFISYNAETGEIKYYTAEQVAQRKKVEALKAKGNLSGSEATEALFEYAPDVYKQIPEGAEIKSLNAETGEVTYLTSEQAAEQKVQVAKQREYASLLAGGPLTGKAATRALTIWAPNVLTSLPADSEVQSWNPSTGEIQYLTAEQISLQKDYNDLVTKGEVLTGDAPEVALSKFAPDVLKSLPEGSDVTSWNPVTGEIQYLTANQESNAVNQVQSDFNVKIAELSQVVEANQNIDYLSLGPQKLNELAALSNSVFPDLPDDAFVTKLTKNEAGYSLDYLKISDISKFVLENSVPVNNVQFRPNYNGPGTSNVITDPVVRDIEAMTYRVQHPGVLPVVEDDGINHVALNPLASGMGGTYIVPPSVVAFKANAKQWTQLSDFEKTQSLNQVVTDAGKFVLDTGIKVGGAVAFVVAPGIAITGALISVGMAQAFKASQGNGLITWDEGVQSASEGAIFSVVGGAVFKGVGLLGQTGAKIAGAIPVESVLSKVAVSSAKVGINTGMGAGGSAIMEYASTGNVTLENVAAGAAFGAAFGAFGEFASVSASSPRIQRTFRKIPTLKYGDVTIPLESGSTLNWKGLYLNKGVDAKILVGKYSDLPVNSKILSRGISGEGTGYLPISNVDSAVTIKAMKKMGYSSDIIQDVTDMRSLMGLTENVKNKYVEDLLPAKTNTLSEKGVSTVKEFVLSKADSVEELYGSYATKSQVSKKFEFSKDDISALRTPGDMDIQLKLTEEGATKFAQDLTLKLQEAGENVRLSESNPRLIEANVGSDKWAHAVDIHFEGEVVDPLTPTLTKAWGFKMDKPSIKIEDIKVMSANEQGIRKGTSILGFKEDMTLGPQTHRIKDVPDFFQVQKTLVESSSKSSTKTKGSVLIDRLASRFEVDLTEPVTIKQAYVVKSKSKVSTRSNLTGSFPASASTGKLVSLDSSKLVSKSASKPISKAASKSASTSLNASLPKLVSKSASKTISKAESIGSLGISKPISTRQSTGSFGSLSGGSKLSKSASVSLPYLPSLYSVSLGSPSKSGSINPRYSSKSTTKAPVPKKSPSPTLLKPSSTPSASLYAYNYPSKKTSTNNSVTFNTPKIRLGNKNGLAGKWRDYEHKIKTPTQMLHTFGLKAPKGMQSTERLGSKIERGTLRLERSVNSKGKRRK